MALTSLTHNNTFTSSSSPILTSKYQFLNPNFTPNLLLLLSTACTNSPSTKHRFYRWDCSHRVRRNVTAAALGGLLGGIFKGGADTGEATRQQYAATVQLVNSLEAELSSVSDSVLRERTDELKLRARQSPQALDSLLPEAFAIVREASKRVLGRME